LLPSKLTPGQTIGFLGGYSVDEYVRNARLVPQDVEQPNSLVKRQGEFTLRLPVGTATMRPNPFPTSMGGILIEQGNVQQKGAGMRRRRPTGEEETERLVVDATSYGPIHQYKLIRPSSMAMKAPKCDIVPLAMVSQEQRDRDMRQYFMSSVTGT
ncbi:hypothetical protein KIPB_010545, partial [Kipferlia bialata]